MVFLQQNVVRSPLRSVTSYTLLTQIETERYRGSSPGEPPHGFCLAAAGQTASQMNSRMGTRYGGRECSGLGCPWQEKEIPTLFCFLCYTVTSSCSPGNSSRPSSPGSALHASSPGTAQSNSKAAMNSSGFNSSG